MPTGTGPIPKPTRRKLDRQRFEATAQPKRPRVIDKAAMATPRSPRCLLCGAAGQTQRHHLKTRGSGGGDVPGNFADLCVACHGAVHRDPRAKRRLALVVALRPAKP